jgi:glycosyltransferase involved in cell wall biosynthesis
MKILCISQYFTPDVTAAAYRISESVDLLRVSGHEVYVITSYPHKSDVKLEKDAEKAESHVTRLPVSAIRGSGIRGYLEQYLGFALRSLFAAMRLQKEHRFDVVWASSPPLFIGITTLLLQLLYRLPVVFDIRDLWPASAVDIGKIRAGSLMERAGLWLESMIYRRSSALTCVSESIRTHIRSKTQRPVEIVYNGVLMDNVRHSVVQGVSQKIICYAGNLGHAQGLDVVLSAFERLLKTPGYADCRLRLIGGGAVEAELKASTQRRGLETSVDFMGVLSKRAVFGELEQCGVLLIPLMDTKTFENAIPSKIFDYMAVGNPIIATVRGEAAIILGRSGGNLVVAPGDVDALYTALCEMERSWPQYAERAKNNISQVKQNYSREAATTVLQRVLSDACEEKKW